jgi:hypothetical protein
VSGATWTTTTELPFALICSACLYVQPRHDLDDDERAWTEVLTVINGQMVCVRHAAAAGGGDHHNVLRTAVHIETGGDEHITLGQYQEQWRAEDRRRKAADRG